MPRRCGRRWFFGVSKRRVAALNCSATTIRSRSKSMRSPAQRVQLPRSQASERGDLEPRGERGSLRQTVAVLTIFGACAVTFMMLMYALERRGRGFVLAFACGCALSSVYGFLAGTWPFGVVEALWALIAVNRYRSQATTPAEP
jgi:hypothetical protein